MSYGGLKFQDFYQTFHDFSMTLLLFKEGRRQPFFNKGGRALRARVLVIVVSVYIVANSVWNVFGRHC